MMKTKNLFLVSMVFCVLFSAIVITAQETPAPSDSAVKPANTRLQLEKAELGNPAMNGLKVEKKLTGRLPNGYRNIVTNKQRDDIYSIQKEYAELIELLKIRIELLEQEKAQQVDALLTSDQVQKIKEANGALESEKLLQKSKVKPKTKSTKEDSPE
ncbi:MAG: hypothetical protein LBU34_04100 [Planctomycetaceae bacterium]|jgi:ABC-type Na+ efflux pump permease subunit|nr:hypothetical protein [Planctomycetaceae bacterium]